MKHFLTFLLFLSTATLLYSQCDAFPVLLQKGDRLLQNRQPDYQEAINAYTAAIIACPERAEEAQQRMSRMVDAMNQLRVNAQRANQEAEQALELVTEAKQNTQGALGRTQQLVDAFYFYEDRFALAFNRGRYYFIDKKGKRIEKLGEWEKAEQFDERGFAKVSKPRDNQAYLLDTLGELYPVAYSLTDMKPNITALDLSGQDLDVLPDSLFNYTELKILLANHNKLKFLPKQISQLYKLEVLDLRGDSFFDSNALTQLPDQLGELSSLRALYLSRNKLTYLPENFSELESLTTLDLDHNKLIQLPNQFGQLNKLKTLYLSINNLVQLPESFGELNNLNVLSLGYNDLKELPNWIGQLNGLTALYLQENKLKDLPESLGELNNLVVLNLSDNDLVQLPNWIGQLNGLTTLYLSGNELIQLPKTLRQLKNLTTLALGGNNIKRLPDWIGQLNNLTKLSLSNNELASLPESFGELTKLNILYLKGNKLSKLPGFFCQLSGLIKLSLSNNELTVLPENFSELNRLTMLYLESNKLTQLPKDFNRLNELTVLDLRYNKLIELPNWFYQLDQLIRLELAGNPLRQLPVSVLKMEAVSYLYIIQALENYSKDSLYTNALNLRQTIQDRKFEASSYFSLSWWLVHCHDFEGAIWAGEAYLAAGGKDIGALSNLAMGYLYNGNFGQAMAIYTTHKATIRKGYNRTAKEIFLEDLDATRSIPAKKPEDVVRARAFLEE